MSLWRQITRGLRVLVNRKTADQDLADEVQHYLEESTVAFMASGLSPEDARRAARLQLGNTLVVRDQVRSSGWENSIGTLFADFRYGARMLRRSPGFTVVAVLTLALGIGATTTIFSAVNPILFEPLPYPHPSRLIMIWDIFQGARSDVTFHTYRELAERNRSLDSLAIMEPRQPTITGPAEPERLNGQSVATSYFRVLGISPVLGRDFLTSDGVFHGPKVVILSDTLWQRRFGGDRAIIGRQITLDGDGYIVIGVMPRTLENVIAPAAEIWSPMQYDAGHITDLQTVEWGHHLRMVGRLRPGISKEQAGSDLAVIARTPVAEFPRAPWASLKFGFIVDSLQDQVTRGVKPSACGSRRGHACALDCVRECDQSSACTRCTAARRIRHARRFRRPAIPLDPSIAYRKFAACRIRWRSRNARGGIRCGRTAGARPA